MGLGIVVPVLLLAAAEPPVQRASLDLEVVTQARWTSTLRFVLGGAASAEGLTLRADDRLEVVNTSTLSAAPGQVWHAEHLDLRRYEGGRRSS